jgi:hypothetical protein
MRANRHKRKKRKEPWWTDALAEFVSGMLEVIMVVFFRR